MILIICGPVVGIIMAWFLTVGDSSFMGNDIVDYIFFVFMAFLMIVLGFIVSGSIAWGLSNLAEQNIELHHTTQLVAIQDNVDIVGSFFLGTGNIEGKLVYYYYEAVGGGGIKPNKIESNNVTIYEVDNIEPRIEHFEATGFKKRILNYILYPMKSHVNIYVPKGSILRNFNLNLGK